MAGNGESPPRVFFLPWFATSHLTSLLDIARLFAARGVRCTLLLTPANAVLARSTCEMPADVLLYPFPAAESGLPPGIENSSNLDDSVRYNLDKATPFTRPAIESLVRLHRPDALVSDAHFSFAISLAAELRIPNISFHSIGLFPSCIIGCLMRNINHINDTSSRPDTEPFLVDPTLPHPIKLVRSEMPEFIRNMHTDLDIRSIMDRSHGNSNFGVVVNSFSSIEAEYARYFSDNGGEKAWFVGPVALAAARHRGGDNKNQPHHLCLEWLDGRAPRSVVYLCFGSWCRLSSEQIVELATGLERCGHPFLWVVRNEKTELPQGFEERVRERGLVVRGWIPQVAVLNHEAVGGFVTHCGWNSLLEGLSAGLPTVTWPLAIEQFISGRLLTEVLRVGVKNWEGFPGALAEGMVVVPGDEVAKAVMTVMGEDEEAEERRRRAREYAAKAREAVREGGSSYEGMNSLVEEIKAWHLVNK